MNTNYENQLGIPSVIQCKSFDNTLDAWLLSKPNIKYNSEEEAKSEVGKLINSNLPISSFKYYFLQIYSSIYFRDILFSFRPCTIWSQSFRNKLIEDEDVKISIECPEHLREKHIRKLNELKDRSRNGEALDVVKRELPITTMMSYSLYFDRRTLITIVKTFEDMDPYLFDLYGKKFLEAAEISIEEYRSMNTFSIYEKLCMTPQLQNSVKDDKVAVIPVMDSDVYFIVDFEFAISAQFIRQHFSKIRYSEFNNVKEKGYRACLNRDCTNKCQVAVLGDIQSFERTVSRRSCWFANFDRIDVDSWASITDKYVADKSSEEFLQLLPCKGCANKCDIFEEFKLRAIKLGDPNLKDSLTPADKNELCPILLEKLKSEKTPKHVLSARHNAQHSNSKTFKKWMETFNIELDLENEESLLDWLLS